MTDNEIIFVLRGYWYPIIRRDFADWQLPLADLESAWFGALKRLRSIHGDGVTVVMVDRAAGCFLPVVLSD